MNELASYWLAPIPAVRPWLLLKATLLLFGFDAFREHLRPAWRYGTADFNVAHFAILDALPIPSTGFYIGVMVAVGLASFVAAIGAKPRRWVLAAIAIAYLWSWSCSMHDSYQHHYLLSLFFIALAFFPLLSARDLFGVPGDLDRKVDGTLEAAPSKKSAPAKKMTKPASATRETLPQLLERALPHGLVPRASSWAMVIVWTTAAIVYTYTAVSKSEPEWARGDALRNITQDGQQIPGAVRLFAWLGIEGADLWPFLGTSVIALQLACALGYATAPLRDRARGPWRVVLEVIAIVALGLALSFHLGAEYMGLQIGWFSWYMIVLALVTFVPARWLSFAALFASWHVRALAARFDREEAAVPTALLATLTAMLLLLLGTQADLPGALIASVAIGVALIAAAVAALVRKSGFGEVRGASIALLLGGLAMIAMLRYEGELPDVRYDYWRFAGGDFRRRGEWALALEAYQHANAHAPEGQSREERVVEMRARIEADGPRRAPQ